MDKEDRVDKVDKDQTEAKEAMAAKEAMEAREAKEDREAKAARKVRVDQMSAMLKVSIPSLETARSSTVASITERVDSLSMNLTAPKEPSSTLN